MKANKVEEKESQEVTVIIEKAPNTGYKASIEGVEGLAVEGNTVVEARKNLWEVIRALKSKLFSGKPFKIVEKVRLFFPGIKGSRRPD